MTAGRALPSLRDEPRLLLTALSALQNVKTEAAFLEWSNEELQKIFPHGMLGCGVALMQGRMLSMQKAIYKNFPQEYLTPFMRPDGSFMTSFMQRVLREGEPTFYEPCAHSTSPQLLHFRKYDLRNIVAQGLHDSITGLTSYFSFFQIPPPLTQEHAHTLDLLVPSMHAALMRICKQSVELTKREELKTYPASLALTLREKEIMGLVMKGITCREIGLAIRRSEHTVRMPVRNVLAKLGVSTRAEAVAALKELSAVTLGR